MTEEIRPKALSEGQKLTEEVRVFWESNTAVGGLKTTEECLRVMGEGQKTEAMCLRLGSTVAVGLELEVRGARGEQKGVDWAGT